MSTKKKPSVSLVKYNINKTQRASANLQGNSAILLKRNVNEKEISVRLCESSAKICDTLKRNVNEKETLREPLVPLRDTLKI